MWKEKDIPVWDFDKMFQHHFGQSFQPPTLNRFHRLFHINKLEDYTDKLHIPTMPYRRIVNVCFLLTKGELRCAKALTSYCVVPHQFFFLPAYQINVHQYLSPDAEGYYLHFHTELLATYVATLPLTQHFPFLQFASEPVIAIEPIHLPVFYALLMRLEELHKLDDEIHLPIIASYLHTLFSEIKPFYLPYQHSKKSMATVIAQQYKDALSKHIFDKQQVTDYADLLAISPNHLNKCVKTATGQSAQQLLNEMLLMEAKVLLKQTSMPVSEIAVKLTQQDHSAFSRFFKTHTGITPKHYRNSP